MAAFKYSFIIVYKAELSYPFKNIKISPPFKIATGKQKLFMFPYYEAHIKSRSFSAEKEMKKTFKW